MIKSTKQLKQQGTFRKDRHAKREVAEEIIANNSKALAIEVVIPEFLVNKELQKYYKSHIDYLISLKMVEPHDLPLLDSAYEFLQRALLLRNQIDVLEAKDSLLDNPQDLIKYEKTILLYKKLIGAYSAIIFKYLVTPAERLKVVLDVQQAEKNQLETKSKLQMMLEAKNA